MQINTIEPSSQFKVQTSISSFGKILSYVDYFDKIGPKCKQLSRDKHRLVLQGNPCLNPIPRKLKEVMIKTTEDLEQILRTLPQQAESLFYFNLRYVVSDYTLEKILMSPAMAKLYRLRGPTELHLDLTMLCCHSPFLHKI